MIVVFRTMCHEHWCCKVCNLDLGFVSYIKQLLLLLKEHSKRSKILNVIIYNNDTTCIPHLKEIKDVFVNYREASASLYCYLIQISCNVQIAFQIKL